MIRWGISATGKIATTMALTLQTMPDATLVAVSSRDAERAQRFAKQYGVAHAFSDFDLLCQCPEVDIIYVASPHSEHYRQALTALQHGKHVLCEKPLTLHVAEAQHLFAEARQRGLFCMEAMWMLFFPAVSALRQQLALRPLGRALHLQARFAFEGANDPANRLHCLALGGGALMDIGIYPLTLAHFLFGNPVTFASHAEISATGVDIRNHIELRFAEGVQASLSSSLVDPRCIDAQVQCEQGVLELAAPFHCAQGIIFRDHAGRELQRLSFPYTGSGYLYEVAAVHEALRAGHTTCPQVLPEDSLQRLAMMCEFLTQWGVVYPASDV